MDKPYEVFAGFSNSVWVKCGDPNFWDDVFEADELTPDQARAMAAELIAAAEKTENR
jgi:hypothetical protein